MKKLLKELSTISKQKILLEPDLIIVTKLVDFENVLPEQSKITDEIFEKIESVLIQLLYSNNSQLSFQCSIRIAECLLLLYQNERKIKIWNLITSFNKKTDLPIIYAIGHVLNKRGKYSKSVVSGVAKTLISINEKFIFGQLFALTACFKSSPQDMKSFIDKSFALIKKFLLIPNEPVQLQCLKLAIRMIKNGQLHHDKIIPLISNLLQDQNMPFIIDESCYLIALLSYSQINQKSTDETEETTKKSKKDDTNQLTKAFSIIDSFKKYFDMVFARFLSLLTPEFINAHYLDLFNIVRRIDVSQMPDLISFFGIDVRRDIFTQVSKESISLEQIKIMSYLAFDSKSLSDTAQLALEVVTRPNPRERMESALFFSHFVKRDPQTATKFLKKAAKFLANPPSDSKTLDNDFKGLSTIVATILTYAPNREQLLELIDDHIQKFLDEAYKCENCLSPYYIPAFTLMTALPRRFYDKIKVEKLLSFFPPFLRSYQTTENEKRLNVEISQSLALFLSVHQEFEQALSIIDLIASTDYLFSDYIQLCIYLAYPHIDGNSVAMAKLGTKLKSIVKKGKAKQEFIFAIVKNPFITRNAYLNNNPEFQIPELVNYFNSCNSKETMYRAYATFPDFISSLPSSSKPIWIQWIVVDCMANTSAHCLIYSLINDKRTQKLLPANLHEVMLSVISTFDQISQIQMAAEIIAVWAKLFPKIINPLLEQLSQKRDKAKCFILAALFSHAQLTDDMIMNQIIELNNLAKIDDDLCPYALFALSSLFLSYSVQLAAMPFTDSQANFLLSLLCTDKTLDSFTLYYIVRAFNALLPIISPDIEKSRPMAIPILKMIIQLTSFDPLPFCKQIFFHMMHSVFSFIRQLGDITMEFPKSKGANLSCKIEACQALADMLILNNLDVDFMNLIPQVLMLLQRTNHNNPNMFIVAVAANFASTSDPTSPLCREQIMKWTQLVKLCISSGTIPTVGNVKIAASDKVKTCMLSVIKEIIPLLLKTSPMINEALDDIMTSLTRAVETKNAELQKIAYPQLLKIVVDFGDFKGENDQPIISLYDIQFASAVKIGFYNLDISGDFVLAFLNFHISNMNVLHDEFISILDYFVSCFKDSKHKTWHYYAVTSRIVEIAMNKEEIYEKIKDFLPRFIKDYAKIIIKAGDLWTEDPPDMTAISLFKANYSSFYPSLIKSFIWIQSLEVEEKIIKPKQLLTFFLSELDIDNNESWRIDGAFQGLTALLQYESDHITNKQLVKIITAVSKTYDNFSETLKQSLPQFLKSASEKLETRNDNSWQQLVSILVDDNFDSLVLCYLIKNGAPETISTYAINFVELIYDCYKSEKCDLEKSIALCTMLFYIVDDRLLDLLEFVLSIKSRKANILDFKFAYLSQLFKFLPNKIKKIINEFGSKLSKLIWNHFENGGQKFLVQLICENKKIAKWILISDEFNDYSLSIIDDIQALNSLFDLFRFILLNFDYLNSDGDFLNGVIMFLLRLIIQWGDDNTKNNIVFQSAQILKMIAKHSSPLIRIAYKQMGEEFQQSAISYIRKFVKAQKNKGKGANIRLFSKSKATRRHRKSGDDDDFDDDGDWQDLTVE